MIKEERDDLLQLMRGPTGHDERLVPEVADPGNLAQHLARYRYSLPYCAGKVVVDLGSGIGYGPEMISQVAQQVYAVDYDASALSYAVRKYRSGRIHCLAGDGTELPLKPALADVVVSFEVIEHVPNHHRLLHEICRVLTIDGRLLISTPNKETAGLFRRKAGFRFDAHVSEVGLVDLRGELGRYFGNVQVVGMRLRGNVLHSLLRALDPWNLRLRLLSKRHIEYAREKMFAVPSRAVSIDDVVISSLQLRQANHFIAICSEKLK